MQGRPWLFDVALYSLKLFEGCTPPSKMPFDKEAFWVQMHNLSLAYMNDEIGHQIGDTIGKVLHCDVDENGNGWGQVLWVFIELDLQKAIPRGRPINIKGDKLWIPITYEKLPRLCFQCGRIVHGSKGCDQRGLKASTQYGSGLRASIGRKSTESRMNAQKRPTVGDEDKQADASYKMVGGETKVSYGITNNPRIVDRNEDGSNFFGEFQY